MSNIKKQYKMNYFDPSENSNKVWIGSAFDDGKFESQFGRVREGANLAVKGKQFSSVGGALAELERKHSEKLRKGFDSTWVKAGTCGVINHECIVYETKQINLRYLCEFSQA